MASTLDDVCSLLQQLIDIEKTKFKNPDQEIAQSKAQIALAK